MLCSQATVSQRADTESDARCLTRIIRDLVGSSFEDSKERGQICGDCRRLFRGILANEMNERSGACQQHLKDKFQDHAHVFTRII